MVVKAFNIWANASGNKINFEVTESLIDFDELLEQQVDKWKEFMELDYNKIYDLIKQKTIVDLRNILNKKEMEKIGFKYVSIGKI